MINAIKTIILALIIAVAAVIFEQAIAIVISIFEQRELVLEFYAHFSAFLAGAAVIEELLKYVAIYFVIKKIFDSRGGNFIFLSTLLGFVWGIFESALAIWSGQNVLTQFQAGNSEIIFSLATVAAVHTLTAFFMGVVISADTFSGRFKYLKILFFPVLTHLLFNFLIIQKSGFTSYLVIASFALIFLASLAIFLFNFRKLA